MSAFKKSEIVLGQYGLYIAKKDKILSDIKKY